MIASFQDPSGGMSHSDAMPENLPEPEDLPSAATILANFDHPITNYWAKARPFDLRHTDEPIYLSAAKEQSAKQCVWFKPITKLPAEDGVEMASLAYASDYSILESMMRRTVLAGLIRVLVQQAWITQCGFIKNPTLATGYCMFSTPPRLKIAADWPSAKFSIEAGAWLPLSLKKEC